MPDLEPRDAEAIEMMLATPGWAIFAARVAAEQKRVTDALRQEEVIDRVWRLQGKWNGLDAVERLPQILIEEARGNGEKRRR